MNEPDLGAWIGRSEETHDVADAAAVARLAALLDHENPPWPPAVLPPLGHWLHFLPEARQSALGPDGHPTRGGFLPPVDLPRRMWAGGRLDFLRAIPFGAEMVRRSAISDISHKHGASGPMTFVTVRHEIVVAGDVAVREEQDIVYRAPPAPGAASAKPAAAADDADWRRSVAPGPVALFRYSALTFNGHRIHYDRPYAMEVEGYPGLVVHGPLIATLLVDNLLRWKPTASLTHFAYRARTPLFDGTRFDLCAKSTAAGARVWAQAPGAPIAMEGEAAFES